MEPNSPFAMRIDNSDMTEDLYEILEKDLLEIGFAPPFMGEAGKFTKLYSRDQALPVRLCRLG